MQLRYLTRSVTKAALFSVQTSSRGGLTKILRSCRDWRTLAFVIKWAFFPSPRYLGWIHEIRCSWLLPLYYPYRPVKYIVRQLWFFVAATYNYYRGVFRNKKLTSGIKSIADQCEELNK